MIDPFPLPFRRQGGVLHAEQLPLPAIAERFGTPCYVYSRAALEARYDAYAQALRRHPHLLCYAVKANSNLAILQLLARRGAGFDIVSGGELQRVQAAGGDAGKVIYSGVGKSAAEIRAALAAGVYCLNAESWPELERIDALAQQLGVRAPVALRVNPDVDPATHAYIATGLAESKFGIPMQEAATVYGRAAELKQVEMIGIGCHIGSQITDLGAYRAALARLLEILPELRRRGIALRHIDLGGGLGIRYRDENPPTPAALVHAALTVLGDTGLTLVLEPGRSIVGPAGVLLTQVEYLKLSAQKNFAIVDAGMNDLIRPALYEAWQEIEAVQEQGIWPTRSYDVVGPVCESGDFLGKSRRLALAPGALLAVRDAGAYGFSMSSNYNTRPRAAEVLVDGTQAYLIRARESVTALWTGEQLLPEGALHDDGTNTGQGHSRSR